MRKPTIKIGVISEYRYTNEELKHLQGQGCVINYTLVPEGTASWQYKDEITKATQLLVYKSKQLIFRIEDFYSGTKEALERALYYKIQCKVIKDNKTYLLNNLNEWRYTYATGNGRDTGTFKHELLQEYENNRREYYESINISKKLERNTYIAEQITETEEEIDKFVRTFAPLYDMQVDYNSSADLHLAYISMKFYLDNNIEYSREPMSSQDTWCYSDTDDAYGDSTYLDDTLYKNGVYADITGRRVLQ